MNPLPDAYLRQLTFNSFLFPRVLGTVLSVACPGAASGLASSAPEAALCLVHRGAVLPRPTLVRPQASPLLLLLLLLCIPRGGATLGQERGTTRSHSCVRIVLTSGQEVLVRRNLGFGVRQVLLHLRVGLVRGSLLFQLRVQHLFAGFPALTQLRVDGGSSCSTPSRAMDAIL